MKVEKLDSIFRPSGELRRYRLSGSLEEVLEFCEKKDLRIGRERDFTDTGNVCVVAEGISHKITFPI